MADILLVMRKKGGVDLFEWGSRGREGGVGAWMEGRGGGFWGM